MSLTGYIYLIGSPWSGLNCIECSTYPLETFRLRLIADYIDYCDGKRHYSPAFYFLGLDFPNITILETLQFENRDALYKKRNEIRKRFTYLPPYYYA